LVETAAKVPSPLPRRIVRLFELVFPTARSGTPSVLKSAVAMSHGFVPVDSVRALITLRVELTGARAALPTGVPA
jgi:hypothetical protein